MCSAFFLRNWNFFMIYFMGCCLNGPHTWNILCMPHFSIAGMCLIIECSWYTSNKMTLLFFRFSNPTHRGGLLCKAQKCRKRAAKIVCLFFHTWIALKSHKKQYKAIKKTRARSKFPYILNNFKLHVGIRGKLVLLPFFFIACIFFFASINGFNAAKKSKFLKQKKN